MVDEAVTVLLVEVRECGRVAGAGEVVPLLLEAVAQLAEVVQLAVEDRDDAAVLVRDRLVAGCQVDHAQASIAERASSPLPDRAVIRAAMADGVGSRAHMSGLGWPCSGRAQEPTDSAHGANRTAAAARRAGLTGTPARRRADALVE